MYSESVMIPRFRNTGYGRVAARPEYVTKRAQYRADVSACRNRGNKQACARMQFRDQREEEAQRRKMIRRGYVLVGKVSMDTASLLISDPAYVVHQKPLARNFGRNYQNFVKHTPNDGHGRQLRHNRGHAGLGVVVYAGGDGHADVYVKPTAHGTISEARIVF